MDQATEEFLRYTDGRRKTKSRTPEWFTKVVEALKEVTRLPIATDAANAYGFLALLHAFESGLLRHPKEKRDELMQLATRYASDCKSSYVRVVATGDPAGQIELTLLHDYTAYRPDWLVSRKLQLLWPTYSHQERYDGFKKAKTLAMADKKKYADPLKIATSYMKDVEVRLCLKCQFVLTAFK